MKPTRKRTTRDILSELKEERDDRLRLFEEARQVKAENEELRSRITFMLEQLAIEHVDLANRARVAAARAELLGGKERSVKR